MLDPKKRYKKGQLVTIQRNVYRIVDFNEVKTCVGCPLEFADCGMPLGRDLCVKKVRS